MQVKFKKCHPDAVVPTYATPGSACFDLSAINIHGYSLSEYETLKKLGQDEPESIVIPERPAVFETGLKVKIPDNHVMLIFSRSGHGFKSNVRLANVVGVLDADYLGEIKVKLTADKCGMLRVKHGDRIAQAMVLPIERVEFLEVDDLGETERGEGGFGSTGA